MSGRTLRVVGVAAVGLAGLAFGFWAAMRHHVLAEAVSPDRSWSVAVVGQPLLLGYGGIEVYAEVRDGRGHPRPGSAFVLGVSPDWAHARATCGAVTCGISQAVVSGQVLAKPGP